MQLLGQLGYILTSREKLCKIFLLLKFQDILGRNKNNHVYRPLCDKKMQLIEFVFLFKFRNPTRFKSQSDSYIYCGCE